MMAPKHSGSRRSSGPANRRKYSLSRIFSFNNIALVGLTISTCFLLYQANSRKFAQRLQAPEGTDGADELEEYAEEDAEACLEDPTDPACAPPPPERKKRKTWKSADTRMTRDPNAPLPALEGLPIMVHDGKKALPAKEMFIHQGNYEKYMAAFKEQFNQRVQNIKSFPNADSNMLQWYNFNTCAVVGSSGTLLNSTYGRAIDSHDTVVRVNQAPTNHKFQKHVGSKTTFRLINTRWTNKYGDVRFLEGDESVGGKKTGGLLRDALEEGVTLIVTRAKPHAYDNMAQFLKAARSDVRALYMSSRVVSSARQLLVGYRVRLEESPVKGKAYHYHGGSTPSSGYLAVYLMLQLCKKLTIYGFGLDAENGKAQSYHYFHLFTDGERKNMMNPTHSFDAERDLMRQLGVEGYLRYCGYTPGNRSHNKKCGLHERKPEDKKKPASVDFAEFESGKVVPEKKSKRSRRDDAPEERKTAAQRAADYIQAQQTEVDLQHSGNSGGEPSWEDQ